MSYVLCDVRRHKIIVNIIRILYQHYCLVFAGVSNVVVKTFLYSQALWDYKIILFV